MKKIKIFFSTIVLLTSLNSFSLSDRTKLGLATAGLTIFSELLKYGPPYNFESNKKTYEERTRPLLLMIGTLFFLKKYGLKNNLIQDNLKDALAYCSGLILPAILIDVIKNQDKNPHIKECAEFGCTPFNKTQS